MHINKQSPKRSTSLSLFPPTPSTFPGDPRMASGFRTRISKNCSPYGTSPGTDPDFSFKVYYAGE